MQCFYFRIVKIFSQSCQISLVLFETIKGSTFLSWFLSFERFWRSNKNILSVTTVWSHLISYQYGSWLFQIINQPVKQSKTIKSRDICCSRLDIFRQDKSICVCSLKTRFDSQKVKQRSTAGAWFKWSWPTVLWDEMQWTWLVWMGACSVTMSWKFWSLSHLSSFIFLRYDNLQNF